MILLKKEKMTSKIPWKYFIFERESDHEYSFRSATRTLESAEHHIDVQTKGGCMDMEKVMLMKVLPLEDYKRVPNHVREDQL